MATKTASRNPEPRKDSVFAYIVRKSRWLWAAVAGVVLYYLDTIVFATPILVLTGWLGGWAAFAILAPIYFLLDYWLGIQMLGLVSGKTVAKRRPLTWLQNWFTELQESSVGNKVRRRLSKGGGRVVRYGFFVAASYTGTAFLTMPAMYMLGQRKHLRLLTAASAAVYAITFVGQYAAIGVVFWKLVVFLWGQLPF